MTGKPLKWLRLDGLTLRAAALLLVLIAAYACCRGWTACPATD